MSRSARRREQRQKAQALKAAGTYVPRQAHASKGTTSCSTTTTPRELVKGYTDHRKGDRDPTVARYIRADKLEDSRIGHGT